MKKKHSTPEPNPETRWAIDSPPVHPPISPIFLAVFALVAFLCFVIAEFLLKPKHPIGATITEHVGIAFLVSVILGATYEYFLHEYRERMFRRLFDEHREKMF